MIDNSRKIQVFIDNITKPYNVYESIKKANSTLFRGTVSTQRKIEKYLTGHKKSALIHPTLGCLIFKYIN